MARARLIRTALSPYHVTARSNNREWFCVPQADCWRAFATVLTTVAASYMADLHAFVLMSNHFHLILSTPLENVDRIMRYLLTEVGRRMRHISGRINHVFGARYKSSVLSDPAALAYAYKYVYRNPVRAGMCELVEHYEFSTLGRLLNGQCPIPIIEGYEGQWRFLPRDPAVRLDWLNAPVPTRAEDLVSLALRRNTFQFTRQKARAREVETLRAHYGIEIPRK